jgi:hypothetical protein
MLDQKSEVSINGHGFIQLECKNTAEYIHEDIAIVSSVAGTSGFDDCPISLPQMSAYSANAQFLQGLAYIRYVLDDTTF